LRSPAGAEQQGLRVERLREDLGKLEPLGQRQRKLEMGARLVEAVREEQVSPDLGGERSQRLVRLLLRQDGERMLDPLERRLATPLREPPDLGVRGRDPCGRVRVSDGLMQFDRPLVVLRRTVGITHRPRHLRGSLVQ
jgi:hypothetical protein